MNNGGPEAILGLARNFMECRILLTGAELNLFSLLASAPLSARELADRIGGNQRALTILLDALCAMGLLLKEKDRYRCSPPSSSFLSSDSARTVLPMVLHMAHLWERWNTLTGIVKGASAPALPSRKTDDLQAFIEAMHVIGAPLAPRIVAAVSPGSSRMLLDVGGGSGTYTLAFLRAQPEMKATLFDRPQVVEIARRRLDEAGVIDRVRFLAGDFSRDELPPGHDLAFLSAVIHQNSPEQNVDLCAKVFRALIRGGRIVIRDHVMAPDRTRPKDGAIFAVNMLVGTSGGNTYTFEDIREALTKAGFIRVRLLQAGEQMDGLVEGFKP
jgi:DNA-binding HxlR family transcriptional regulator